MSVPNKRLAIENHSTSIFDGSITADKAASISAVYRVIKSPYGFRLHFDSFVFYVELIQHGIGCNSAYLGYKYPVGYLNPDNRKLVSFTSNSLPIDIPLERLQYAIARYCSTEIFLMNYDHLRLDAAIAILTDNTIVLGVAAKNIYLKGKLTYNGIDVVWRWIPNAMRPKQVYRVERDRKAVAYAIANKSKNNKPSSFKRC